MMNLISINRILILFTGCMFFMSCNSKGVEDININEGLRYRALEAAAIEMEVPPLVLLAVSYVESHWEMLEGEVSKGYDTTAASWGLMGLTEGRNLEKASNAIGIDIDDIKFGLLENARAGAALLAVTAVNTLGDDYAEKASLGDWRDVLASYSGFDDFEKAMNYVDEVINILRIGAGRTLSNGEVIEFEGAGDLVDEQFLSNE